jgi:hypothetical protein
MMAKNIISGFPSVDKFPHGGYVNIRVDTKSVVSLSSFVFYYQIKVGYCFIAHITVDGQGIADIGNWYSKYAKKGVNEITQFPGSPSVDKFPYENYVKLRRHSKRCIFCSFYFLRYVCCY